nr:isoform 2 of f-box/wd repeat-containing protein 1a [Quercus suber]
MEGARFGSENWSISKRTRGEIPDTRPHTAHASPTFHVDSSHTALSDDEQLTPRASSCHVAHTRIFAGHPNAVLRDDTATDGLTATFAAAKAGLDDGDPLRAQRRPARRMLSFHSSSTSSSESSSAITSAKAQTLPRKFSRTYKERIADLRDKVTQHAPLAARMRRSSTASMDSRSREVYPPPPLSPSKRNASQQDFRGKKLRPTIIGHRFGSDRKDTPAPTFTGPGGRLVACVQHQQQPHPQQQQQQEQQQQQQVHAPFMPFGGDGARAAAAAYNIHGVAQFSEDVLLHEDTKTRRRRIGSLCDSAADSGADLSTYSDTDVDCDTEMLEGDDVGSVTGPAARDFTSLLPSEISLQIFEYLNAHELGTAQQVSKFWQNYAVETSVWRTAYLRRYGRQVFTHPPPIQVGGVGVGRPNLPMQEWKKMYKARVELEKNWRKGASEAGKAVYLSGHTDSVYCLQFDEEKIITGSRDRTIRVWDINTFQCLRVIGGPNVQPVLGPKVLRTVDYPSFHMATASVNGTSYGNSIFQVPSQWHDASILCLQYDEEILVTGSSDSDLLVWDIRTYEPIKRLKKHTGGVLDVALDANHIVSCSKDSRIIVWDRKTMEPKGDLTGHRGPVNAVQLRGKYLVSASGDGIARLWDLEQMKLIKEFSAKERGLAAVEFSEDMKYVLAGGNDHITYKFETETGAEVKQFTGHSQLVRSLWLDSANSRVVSGSYDLDLRVYDFLTGEEIWRAQEWTTSWMLAAKSDYRRIVATSQDGRILIVDFGLQKGGITDGEKIDNVDLLRGCASSAIVFTNPWIDRPAATTTDGGSAAPCRRRGA